MIDWWQSWWKLSISLSLYLSILVSKTYQIKTEENTNIEREKLSERETTAQEERKKEIYWLPIYQGSTSGIIDETDTIIGPDRWWHTNFPVTTFYIDVGFVGLSTSVTLYDRTRPSQVKWGIFKRISNYRGKNTKLFFTVSEWLKTFKEMYFSNQ